MGSRRAASPPPDRLAAVLGEVDRARRGGWVPQESTVSDERPRRRPSTGSRRDTSASVTAADRAGHRGGEPDRVRPYAPLIRTPSSLQGAQVGTSRLALVGVLMLVAAAVVVLGGRMMWVRAMAEPHPARGPLPVATSTPSGIATSSARTRVPGVAPAAAGPTSAATSLLVHVVGQVRQPGVVRLTAGARVQDAVRAAGGTTGTADLARVNLARPVVDGEQVVIPRPGEQVDPVQGPPAATGLPTAAGGTGGTAAAVGAPVDLNAADETALDALPGVGPVIAQRIVQWRTDNGRFSTVEELSEVSGIGDKLMEKLRPLVRV
ncbi:helix-hairpin-helix domain-containing protein [Luteipulveratus flavus]|uniref:Helix-hairpin-helix domain-containing protein n=1 Tax=Luteipulveratus flavus TaxID=3031728 RepID=A0ABT6C8K6_9MICO|nr:helix-hairpin-helix domain-containing protein [Luteipulveratus sp. YIM 133296]MDF8265252.1 helix-hairpin-helix domain-containing protein [Luteipulveratus sp. YIM 133296]